MSDTTYPTGGRLTEWLSSNQHRAYPLDTTTGGYANTIPCSVFVDALLTTTGIATEHFFISKVVTDENSAKFYVSDNSGFICMLADISLDETQGTEIAVNYKDASHIIVGSLILGDIKAIKQLPATTTITEEAGRFFPSCIRDASAWLVGLKVGDEILTGVVNLVAGDGVVFEKTVVGDTTTLTIRAAEYVIPQATRDLLIENDTELVTRLEEVYGKPVRSINGILPDNTGNIAIKVADETEASYMAEGSGNTGYIVLKNSKDNTGCCSDDSVDIIMNNIANLNERASRIDATITVIDSNLNTIATQLVGIKK